MTEKNMITTSRFDHPVGVVFQDMFLAYALGLMPHSQFGKKNTMPEHAGTTMKWRRLSTPLAQTTPLDETTDPSPIMPSKTDLSASVVEYGANTLISGWLDLTGLNQNAAELTKWLSDTFRLTIDTLDREVLATGASSYTCANGSPTTTLLNSIDLDIVVQTLLGYNAQPITQRMGAATGQGTSPLMPSFIAIAHTDLWRDLKAVAGFREVKNYADPGDAYEGEVGATDMIRWILTSNGYNSGGSYYCPVIGQDAYGNVRIPGGDKLLGYKPPETAGSRMNRFSIYFWLANYVSRILDDSKILTVICTKSV